VLKTIFNIASEALWIAGVEAPRNIGAPHRQLKSS
jgi:hypothetical protein